MTDKHTIDAAVAHAACCGYDLAEQELSDLRAQVAALTAERDEAKRVAEAATAVYLKRFDADTATMELKSKAFRNLAEMAYSYAEACGMKNYVEATVRVGPLQAKDGEERFFVTLQRCHGKTPAELKVEAERERDQLRDQLEVLTAQLEEEERMVRRLREAVLGATKGRVMVEEVQRYAGSRHIIASVPENWPEGTKVALVRLSPDGLEMAGEVDNKEGADA